MLSPACNVLILLGSFLIAASQGNLSHDRSQPTTSDEIVVAGSKVLLQCEVEDPDDSSLQWSNPAQQTLYFGEKRALRDLRIQLERSTPNELTISIDNATLADEGEYTCSIFTMPVRTAKAIVTVLGIPQKPQISGYSDPLKEGDVAQLMCFSSGSKPAAELRWHKGDKLLSAEPPEVEEDANGKTFTVTSRVEFTVGKEDNGVEVTCTVDHESLQNSDKSTSQKLAVFYKPTAEIKSYPDSPREGQNLRLRCDGRGNPIPQEYKWEKQGVQAPLAEAQDNVLVFDSLNKSDSGTYICYASSIMGISTAIYNLNVHENATVIANSLEKTLMLGKMEGTRRRGQQRPRWLDSFLEATNMSLTKLREAVEDRSAWRALVHGVTKNRARLNDLTTTIAQHVEFEGNQTKMLILIPLLSYLVHTI